MSVVLKPTFLNFIYGTSISWSVSSAYWLCCHLASHIHFFFSVSHVCKLIRPLLISVGILCCPSIPGLLQFLFQWLTTSFIPLFSFVLYHTSRRSIHKCHIESRSTLLYRHLWWSSLTSKMNASLLRLHSRLSSAWLQLPTQPYCLLFP